MRLGKITHYTVTVQHGILMHSNRIVIPSSLRDDILDRLYMGHQGLPNAIEEPYSLRMWWPGPNTQLEELVIKCAEYYRHRVQNSETLLPGKFPKLPWYSVEGCHRFIYMEQFPIFAHH